ncbi:hypothetical protein D3C75_1309930 [compost metagenome]
MSVDRHLHRVARLRISINRSLNRHIVSLFGIDDVIRCHRLQRDVGTNRRIEGKSVSIGRGENITGSIMPGERDIYLVITFS